MKNLILWSLLNHVLLPSEIFAQSTEQKSITINSIGDSISTGFNARNIGDNRDLSWGSGDSSDIDSHLKKLKNSGFTVSSFNNAKAGATINDLKTQIDAVISNKAEYVTMTLGANDVCSWPSNHLEKLEDFKSKLENELLRAIEQSPKIKFILSPVPNLLNLWEIGRNHGQCQSRWDFFRICSPLLNSRRTTEERTAFMSRWHDINNVLKDVADQYPDNVSYAEEISQTQFELEHVSEIDCFHPSLGGQNLLANLTWAPLVQQLIARK